MSRSAVAMLLNRARRPWPEAARRARMSFWLLLAVSAVCMASLSGAIAAPGGPLTAMWLAASGLVLVIALVLEARVIAALDRARRADRN